MAVATDLKYAAMPREHSHCRLIASFGFAQARAQDRARIAFDWRMANDPATIKGEHK